MTSDTQAAGSKPKYDIAELSIALVSGLALAITALFLCVAPLTGQIAGARDFVVYWATGHQLVHHANPYDVDSMMRIERDAGLPPRFGALFMRNPPWALPITYPLGFIGVRLGALLWSMILLGCLWASVYMVWQLHGCPRPLLNFLGYSFAPALMCLIVGQTSIFALLGLALFLRLYRSRPFLAGVSLWLCALKPHLFLAFGVVLLAWIVLHQAWKILLGGIAALAVSSALAWLIEPTAWHDYSHMMRTYGIEFEFIPCWSVVLRLWTRPHLNAIQYILPAIGCTWALGYFWKHRRAWDWLSHGSLLMVVSLLCAPYAWLFDQAVIIPALLQGAYRTRSRIVLTALAVLSISVEVLLVMGYKLPSPVFLYTQPAWFLWYLAARATAGQEDSSLTA